MTKSKDHETLRIICGNQIEIMQALMQQTLNNNPIKMRIGNIKEWWKNKFNETVGPTNDWDRENFK